METLYSKACRQFNHRASNTYAHLRVHTINALYSGNHLIMGCWSVRLFAIYSQILPPHQQGSWQIGVVAKGLSASMKPAPLRGPRAL